MGWVISASIVPHMENGSDPRKKPKEFCSDACRMKWWAQHKEQMERTLYTITCAQCGCSFEIANPKQKFCSRACYAESRRKNVQTAARHKKKN